MIMEYKCNASKKVKPSIVKMTFNIRKENIDSKQVVTDLKDTVDELRTLCVTTNSYKYDSYEQQNINFRKNNVKEYYYINSKTNKTITVDEYNKLKDVDRVDFEKRYRVKLVSYIASVTINIILNNNNTVVNDFTKIINKCIELAIDCNYEHTITEEERDKYMRVLYANCINNGIEAITEIASDIKCYDKNKVEVLSITDTNISNGMYERDLSPMLKRCSMNSDYEEEQYFIPEFIKELFNNNIILKKELVLKVQL